MYQTICTSICDLRFRSIPFYDFTMNTDLYIKAGFNILRNNTVTVSGVEVDCVLDMAQYDKQRNDGFNMAFTVPVMILSSSLANAKSFIGKTAEINSEQWRIQSVKVGAATTILNLISVHTV